MLVQYVINKGLKKKKKMCLVRHSAKVGLFSFSKFLLSCLVSLTDTQPKISKNYAKDLPS